MIRFAIFLACLLFFASCSQKSKEPQIPFARLEFIDATPANLHPIVVDLEKAKQNFESMLARAGYFKVSETPDHSQWRASIQARVVYGFTKGDGLEEQVSKDCEAQAMLSVALRLLPPLQSEAVYLFEQTQSKCPLKEAPNYGVEAQIDEVIKAMEPLLKTKRQLLYRDQAGLIAALDDERPAMRIGAAELLGMSRAQGAVPQICDRLQKEQDRAVLLRLIGALAEIGDARAVTALIAVADSKDRELLRAVIDALSSIGGEQTNDFFDLLENHDSPEVRYMLEEARKHLNKSEP